VVQFFLVAAGRAGPFELFRGKWFFAVFSGKPAAIGFVFLCDLRDSARAMKPNEITAQIRGKILAKTPFL